MIHKYYLKRIAYFITAALVLTILKLGGIITWSWWWVLLPIWGVVAVNVILIILAVLCFIGLVISITLRNGWE